MTNWDNYRYLIALEHFESLSAAARELGVSQPTVSRRLAELEKALDVELLERLPDGARLTAAGRKVCQGAKLIERQATQIELDTRGDVEANLSRVRVAVSEGIASAFLTQLIARFCLDHGHIAVDLLIANRPANVLSREADIAIRLGHPKDENLIGRRVGEVEFGLYGHDHYLAKNGVPKTTSELAAHTIIEATGEIARLPQAVWLRERAKGARIGYSANSILNQIQALTACLGLLALPTYAAVDLNGIRQVTLDDRLPKADLWLLTERSVKEQSAVRALLDNLAKEIPRSLQRLSPADDGAEQSGAA